MDSRKSVNPSRSRRPLGVTIIGYTYALLFGAQGLVSTFNLAFSSAARKEMHAALEKLGIAMSASQFESIVSTLVIVQTIFSFGYLVVGVGLLRRKEWARRVLIYFIFASAIIALAISIFQPQFAFYLIVFLLYPALVFWYLTKAENRDWFKK